MGPGDKTPYETLVGHDGKHFRFTVLDNGLLTRTQREFYEKNGFLVIPIQAKMMNMKSMVSPPTMEWEMRPPEVIEPYHQIRTLPLWTLIPMPWMDVIKGWDVSAKTSKITMKLGL